MTERRRLDREGALELLRSQHTFPGPYVFRVVVRPDFTTGVVTAIAAALGEGGSVHEVEEKSSRAGNYISLRVHANMPEAERVLDVYEVIGRLEGVVVSL